MMLDSSSFSPATALGFSLSPTLVLTRTCTNTLHDTHARRVLGIRCVSQLCHGTVLASFG